VSNFSDLLLRRYIRRVIRQMYLWKFCRKNNKTGHLAAYARDPDLFEELILWLRSGFLPSQEWLWLRFLKLKTSSVSSCNRWRTRW